jgi:peptide/nickel transport system permease protein
VPVAVLAVGGTAGLIREVRANLLDQLEMPYVVTARAKGLSEWKLLLKYPVRIAVNPIVSTIGWMLPGLVSGAVIVDIVLSLPTSGPLLLNALQDQDMYLAGSFVMLLSTLTVIGTLISDILLAWVDPRIRFERQTS